MKSVLLVASALLAFPLKQCKTAEQQSKNSLSMVAQAENKLFKTWLRSYEEDADGIEVYRPNTYNFAPARRGRSGFSFETGGKFIEYRIAPTDGLEGIDGRWEKIDDKNIRITFPNNKAEPYHLEIVSVEDSLLKVHKK